MAARAVRENAARVVLNGNQTGAADAGAAPGTSTERNPSLSFKRFRDIAILHALLAVVASIAAVAIVSDPDWPEGRQQCQALDAGRLDVWVAGFIARHGLGALASGLVARTWVDGVHPAYQPSHTRFYMGMRDLLTWCSIALFFIGNAAVARVTTYCASQAWYKLGLGLLLITYAQMLLPIIAVVFFMAGMVCCMPTMLRILSRLGLIQSSQRPATRRDIARLPELPFVPGMQGLIGDASCPICLSNYGAGDKLRRLPCAAGHHFHKACIDEWLGINANCPVCRAVVFTPEGRLVEPGQAGEREVGVQADGSALSLRSPNRIDDGPRSPTSFPVVIVEDGLGQAMSIDAGPGPVAGPGRPGRTWHTESMRSSRTEGTEGDVAVSIDAGAGDGRSMGNAETLPGRPDTGNHKIEGSTARSWLHPDRQGVVGQDGKLTGSMAHNGTRSTPSGSRRTSGTAMGMGMGMDGSSAVPFVPPSLDTGQSSTSAGTSARAGGGVGGPSLLVKGGYPSASETLASPTEDSMLLGSTRSIMGGGLGGVQLLDTPGGPQAGQGGAGARAGAGAGAGAEAGAGEGTPGGGLSTPAGETRSLLHPAQTQGQGRAGARPGPWSDDNANPNER